MKVDSVIRWFMPKEERFHDLLGMGTANLEKAVRSFSEIAHSSSLEERRVKVVELKGLEHEGDHITRQILEALNKTFITPLDREDIRSLASDLDDIVDHVEGVAHYLVLFEISGSPEGLRQFAKILEAMAEQISRATHLMWNLSHEKEIQDAIVRISELENQGDALYNTVITDLFKGTYKEPVEIMKWKEIYDGLEAACDDCKEYTHVLGNVVIKNA